MEFSRQAVWAKLKTPAEFITALIALIGLAYGVVWVLDEIVVHVHIRVAHGWWAYRFWHASWRLLAPILMVAAGRLWPRRVLGQLLWAVGVVWLIVLAFGTSMALYGGLLMSLAVSFGWVVGTTLSLAAIIPLTLVVVLVGSLVDRARKQSRLFDRLIAEICWMPDRTAKTE
jgi:hypothetical protein